MKLEYCDLIAGYFGGNKYWKVNYARKNETFFLHFRWLKIINDVVVSFIAIPQQGASAVFVSHPIDTIKVWQQVFKTSKGIPIHLTVHHQQQINHWFSLNCYLQPFEEVSTTMYNIIIRSNGLNGFYKGFYFPFFTHGIINSAGNFS